jgi:hypothetical protein
MSLIGLLWHTLILTPTEEGWLKGGVKDSTPMENLNFKTFLNAARTTDLIASSIIFGLTLIASLLPLFSVHDLNTVFLYWAEILFFASMVLPWIAPPLMVYSFENERSATYGRITEQAGNMTTSLGMMVISLIFLPDLRIWYSKYLITCKYDSVFDSDGKTFAFGSTWSN